jgi:integrase
MSWAARNDIIPDNPASEAKVDTPIAPKKRPRVPFTDADLKAIFDKAGKPQDEFSWSMVISLYSGLRASELAQMKLASVRKERGVLCFVVEEDVKTLESARFVPVHSALIGYGIERRIAKLKAAGKTHLFPVWYAEGLRLKELADKSPKGATINQHWARVLPRQFNDKFLPSVGINDKRKKWHSWRHTAKTALAHAGVPRDVSDAITGHADGTAGGTYIHGGGIKTLQGAIERLQFEI